MTTHGGVRPGELLWRCWKNEGLCGLLRGPECHNTGGSKNKLLRNLLYFFRSSLLPCSARRHALSEHPSLYLHLPADSTEDALNDSEDIPGLSADAAHELFAFGQLHGVAGSGIRSLGKVDDFSGGYAPD